VQTGASPELGVRHVGNPLLAAVYLCVRAIDHDADRCELAMRGLRRSSSERASSSAGSSATSPPHAVLMLGQAEVRLVDERCRIDRMVRPVEAQMTVGDLMQIVVYQLDQPVERGLVTRTPRFDKLGDVAAGG
jgi:hypothetical protein